MGEARKILKLQKQIYAAYERELAATGVSGPPELIQLKKRLYRKLAKYKKLQTISREDLSRKAAESSLVLVGDYHSLPRCQQSAGHFLLELAQATGRPPLVTMECFSTSHDPLLAAWQKGMITLETLRRTSAFDERWGFPWEGYAYLLSHLQDAGIKVMGLEASPHRTGIKHRDQDMATRLMKLLEEEPDRQVVAIVGDLHLAQEALPAALAEYELQAFRVFQNMEPLYWRLAADGRESVNCNVILDPSTSCILETHPLLKVQSALNWLDGLDTLGGEGECEGLTQRFLHLTETIAAWLEIPFPATERLHVLATDPMEFLEKLSRTGVGTKEVSRAMDKIRSTGSYVHPPTGLVYLSNPTINEAAEAATCYLRQTIVQPLRKEGDSLDNFLDHLCNHALGWLGSLLINPERRPLPTTRLAHLFADQNPEAVAHSALELSRGCLTCIEDGTNGISSLRQALENNELKTIQLTAKILGERIGQTWFRALQEDRLSRSALRDFFCAQPQKDADTLQNLKSLICNLELPEKAT